MFKQIDGFFLQNMRVYAIIIKDRYDCGGKNGKKRNKTIKYQTKR